jgi:hypothetical protein
VRAIVSGLLIVVVFLPALAGAAEGKQPDPYRGEALAFHEGARVTLLLDKKEYFLGENILLHYCLENTSKTPFQIQSGMDMNSVTGRQVSFEVIAKGEDGKPVDDLYQTEAVAGMGMGSYPVLKPAEKFYESIQLVRFCRFEKPGVYTIRVVHDLGWRLTGDQKFPVGEIKIKLVMPTPEQARRVVEDMYKLPKDPNVDTGQMCPPYADFVALRHPVYLPILLEYAQRGDVDALEAIGEMPTPEATKALIGLLDHTKRAFAVKAAGMLSGRLPYAEESEWGQPFEAESRWLVARAWRPEFAPQVMAHARKFLSWHDDDALAVAGDMVQSLGGKDDLPYLITALDYAVPASEGLWRKSDSDPNLPGPCFELSEAAEILAKRGADISGNPESPGQKVAFLAALKSKQEFRPKGWEATVSTLLKDKLLYIRQLAVESLPRPLSKPFVEMLPTLLADPAVIVRIKACEVAKETKARELRQPILDILATSESLGLLLVARDAASVQGIRAEALEVLASRIADTNAGWDCFWLVTTSVVDLKGASFGSFDVIDSEKIKGGKASTADGTRARWIDFLKRHREAIQAGRKFKPGDPELTPDLIPPPFKINLQNGKQWP